MIISRFRLVYVILLLFLHEGFLLRAQSRTDSLLKIARSETSDTTRVNAYNSAAREYIHTRPDSGIFFAKKALDLVIKNLEGKNDLPGKVKAAAQGALLKSEDRFYVLKLPYVLNTLASLHGAKGEYSQALAYTLQSLDVQEIIASDLRDKDEKISKKLKSLEAGTLGTLGNIYTAQAEYPKALECFFKALAIDEQMGDERAKANHLGNMGIIYDDQKEFEKALGCYNKALEIYRALGDSGGVETCYTNIGVVYDDQGELDKALGYYLVARKMQEEMGMEQYTGTIGNIGNIYKKKGDPDRALSYYLQAILIDKELDNKAMIAQHYANIGDSYRMKKEYARAEEALMSSLGIAEQISALDIISKSESYLSDLYEDMGEWQKAYRHYKNYISARDSIFNEEKSREMGRMEGKFESEKQLALAEKEHEKELAVEQEKQARQRVISYTAAGGLFMVGVFAFVIFNRLRLTRRQKAIIEEQKVKVDEQNRSLADAKNIIEEKNRDIVDSINYARRLQEAIFPSRKIMQEKLGSSFIYYKPKDIVAGDFYWLEAKGDEVLFAVADCTGHGVPGAMVSVVCSNALNRAVKEFGITDPGKILDKVTDLVIETFEKSENEVNDGMDISLWSLNRETLELRWAGANNPLWIVPGNVLPVLPLGKVKEGEGLIELLPDKQPVGRHESRHSFVTHCIRLHEGDTIYLFSDGFADQFGGQKGKKFKYSQLKQLLVSVSGKPMNEQRELLHNAFESWRGNLEQVDDVCVAGIRI